MHSLDKGQSNITHAGRVLIIGGTTVAGLALIIAAFSWPTANSPDLQYAPTQNNEDGQVVNSDTMIEKFQAGHGFFNQVTVGGLQTDDNDEFTLGEQSLRLTTNGDGSAIFTRKANISPHIDLDNKLLKVWVKVSDTSKLDELRITVTSDRFETHRNYWLYGPNQLSTPLEDNEWTILTIGPERIEDVGSPDLSRIDTMQLRLADNGAGPVSVWFNGIESIEEEDSQS